MKYLVSLEHKEFVMLIDILRKAREADLIAWDAPGFVCERTKLEP